ncbi:TPA: DNA cytosine methyltransferase [Vibrio harveyi]|nr:DNA cytosine methyltransferase [Vibrio harveyi]
MNHLDLFSGIGGFSLAGMHLGINTIAFCEIDEGCHPILNKIGKDIPIYRDIKEIHGDEFGHVDIITGGYPCQPFSVAGSQKAQKDDRHLWPEMFRVIAHIRPTWVVCENVYGHVKLGLDCVLNDLESIGYTTRSFVIPSLATGGNHRRDRVFIVAYTSGNGRNESKIARGNGQANDKCAKGTIESINNERCRSLRSELERKRYPSRRRGTKPPPLRVDDELPRRMDRNRMIGNSVDPEIAFEILKSILLCELS